MTEKTGAADEPLTTDALTDAERQFLAFALDQAAEEMFHRDGFTDEDWAALRKFRRMIGVSTD
ncbi:hypothetical protein [Streptomyces mirabilis]|uniref:hypothetical protein n=1 Tax=Streptomyces mirabilis TaxID=68239 RepID=UPI00367B966A